MAPRRGRGRLMALWREVAAGRRIPRAVPVKNDRRRAVVDDWNADVIESRRDDGRLRHVRPNPDADALPVIAEICVVDMRGITVHSVNTNVEAFDCRAVDIQLVRAVEVEASVDSPDDEVVEPVGDAVIDVDADATLPDLDVVERIVHARDGILPVAVAIV